MDGLCLKTGIHGMAPAISVGAALEARVGASHVSAVARSTTEKSTVAAPSQKTASSRFSFRYPLRSLWPGGGGVNDKRYNGLALDDAILAESNEARKAAVEEETGTGGEMSPLEEDNGNWVLKILQIKSLRSRDEQRTSAEEETKEEKEEGRNGAAEAICQNDVDDEEGDTCDVCRVDEEEENEIEFDRNSFSRMLKKVSLAEAKVYAQMSFLGNLAYSVSKIKPGNLLKYRGLCFITSSVEKRKLATKAEKNHNSAKNQGAKENTEEQEPKDKKIDENRISVPAAYEIAASAASYLHSHIKSLLPFKSSGAQASKDTAEGSSCSDSNAETLNLEVASLMATTDSVTAVVAAKEEVKQAVADDLKSTCSSPCEWFICDDDQTATRFFVIQGSESLASWQANLLFEPVQFEGLDVIVHRGIYEAAKGIYDQMLPEARAHLQAYGSRASFRFTGHSLGGSLSLLINLMLLIRGEVPASSLLPVITFGSPSIMCGGDRLLRKLGLPQSHVQAVTMHRDIVPRAFSCHYPNHVAELLKAVNGNFRNHPCLNNQKLLYAPMGELLILQPDEKFSPQHHLLPSGSGLYLLSCPLSTVDNAEKQLRAAQMVFLNSPHPLEILSDQSAYGSEGSIQRDHDMNSYLKAVRAVVRQELSRIRKVRREDRRKMWWPLVLPRSINSGIMVGTPVTSINMGQEEFKFFGVLQTGRESLRRFSRLVASQHMHLFVLMLLPAKLLLVGAYNVIRLR